MVQVDHVLRELLLFVIGTAPPVHAADYCARDVTPQLHLVAEVQVAGPSEHCYVLEAVGGRHAEAVAHTCVNKRGPTQVTKYV